MPPPLNPKGEDKSMQAKIAIIIISLLLVFMGFLLIFTLNNYERDFRELTDKLKTSDELHLETLNGLTQDYNNLLAEYDALYESYVELGRSKGLGDGWQDFVITAYTSKDPGCNSYSSLGINIEQLASQFNFCAVDPDVIPYGSVVLINLANDIEPFLAVDCGGAIKGNHIDLYFENDIEGAFDFGKQMAKVKVIK